MRLKIGLSAAFFPDQKCQIKSRSGGHTKANMCVFFLQGEERRRAEGPDESRPHGSLPSQAAPHAPH